MTVEFSSVYTLDLRKKRMFAVIKRNEFYKPIFY